MKKFSDWHFLAIIAIFYFFIFFLDANLFWKSFIFSCKLLLKIIPIFIFIFILMVIVNRYVKNDFILEHMRGNKIKSWFYVIIGGILSTGPIYMWYPLLKDLRKKGIKNGEIACFLYNRSIKPTYLPLIIFYFGWWYVLILTVMMISASLLQAFIIGKILPELPSTGQ